MKIPPQLAGEGFGYYNLGRLLLVTFAIADIGILSVEHTPFLVECHNNNSKILLFPIALGSKDVLPGMDVALKLYAKPKRRLIVEISEYVVKSLVPNRISLVRENRIDLIGM